MENMKLQIVKNSVTCCSVINLQILPLPGKKTDKKHLCTCIICVHAIVYSCTRHMRMHEIFGFVSKWLRLGTIYFDNTLHACIYINFTSEVVISF